MSTEALPGSIALVHRRSDGQWHAREVSAGVLQETEQATEIAGIPAPVLSAIRLPNGSLPGTERILKAKRNLWLYVAAGELPCCGYQKSGVYVVNPQGTAQFYPVPVPTAALCNRLRRRTGEVPQIAPWSGSALLLDSGSIWIGLMRQPEGAAYGGGVLRFDMQSGSARKYPVNDYVATITRDGSTLYFGTAHGVYVYDTDKNSLAHVRVEPGLLGPLKVVTLNVEMK